MPRIRINVKIAKSELEDDFEYYCEELKLSGYIEAFNKFPSTKVISEPVYYKSSFIGKRKVNKTFNKTLLQRHEYTPDFTIAWNKSAKGVFFRHWDNEESYDVPFLANKTKDGKYYSVIEIKPGFDMENMQRLFTINQKWIMQKFNLYVQKIIICNNERCIFSDTFTPVRWMTTKKLGKAKIIKFTVRGIHQYVDKRKQLLSI
jgi:beta-xylosidase